MLAFGGDVVVRLEATHAARRIRQEVEREVDAVKVTAGQLHVARHAGADGNHDSVVAAVQVIPRDVFADRRVGDEAGAFGSHLFDTAVDEGLLELEVRDAEAQQATDLFVALIHDDGVAGAGQLLGAGQACGAGADDRHGEVREALGRQRLDEAQIPCLVDDGLLVVVDHRRRLVDAQHAGGFTQRRADAAGELREVVGLGQAVVCVLPLALAHEVIPLGNEVAQRAAGHAERRAAVHAAGRLRLRERRQAMLGVNVEPIVDALLNRAFFQLLTGAYLKESTRVSHFSALLPSRVRKPFPKRRAH